MAQLKRASCASNRRSLKLPASAALAAYGCYPERYLALMWSMMPRFAVSVSVTLRLDYSMSSSIRFSNVLGSPELAARLAPLVHDCRVAPAEH